MSWLLAAAAEALLILTSLVAFAIWALRAWVRRRALFKPDLTRPVTRRELRAFRRFMGGKHADAAITAWTAPRRRGGEGASR